MSRLLRRVKSLPILREKLSNDEIVIGFMGYTGSGMSKFIHEATGLYAKGIGKQGSVRPYTRYIEMIRVVIPGIPYADFPIVFVDTPGMQFADKNDEQMCVNQLKNWLRRHGDNLLLSGLLYLHKINPPELQTRIVPFSHIYLKDLCSSPADPKNKIFLVSTHWPLTDEASRKAESAEKDIVSKYWKHFDCQSVRRFPTPNRQSAWEILMPMIEDVEAVREEKLQGDLRELEKSMKDAKIVDDIRKHLSRKKKVHHEVRTKFMKHQEATREELEQCERLKEEGKKLWEDLKNSKPGGNNLKLMTLRQTLRGTIA